MELFGSRVIPGIEKALGPLDAIGSPVGPHCPEAPARLAGPRARG